MLRMPKIWLYFIALCFPLFVRVLVLDTSFTSWLWYHGYKDSYFFFSTLSINPMFLKFIGGWALPAFVVTVMSFWLMESFQEDDEIIAYQFLLAPLMYVPFTIICEFISTLAFTPMMLFSHPVVIIPFGYIYVAVWLVFIGVMERCHLVM
jgi:hypothetical protein